MRRYCANARVYHHDLSLASRYEADRTQDDHESQREWRTVRSGQSEQYCPTVEMSSEMGGSTLIMASAWLGSDVS